MRKRTLRPAQFVQLSNAIIDDAVRLDFMALALLAVLLRHQDGWEITLADIGKKYGYGRDALSKAMGLLQVARYVVKIRLQSAGDNQWSTEVVVCTPPATDAEVEEMLAATRREPGVRDVQVIPPTKTQFEHAAARRAKLAPKRRQGPTVSIPSPEAKEAAAPPAPATPGGEGGRGAGSKPPAAKPAKGTKPAKGGGGKPEQGQRMSRETAAAMKVVEAAWPPELAELLPSYRPPVLRDAILDALDSRTPEQLAERVRRRWTAHGYALDVMPEGKGIGSPVGVAVALVRPSTECPEPMCEDGQVLDRGEPCRACATRRGDHRRAGAGVPAQREADMEAGEGPARPEWWECRECAAPGQGEQPVDLLCKKCRAAAVEAAAVAERLAAEMAAAEEAQARRIAEQVGWLAMLDDAYAEHAEREKAAAAARERRRQEEAEQTRLLREQIAAEHPELAAFAQS